MKCFIYQKKKVSDIEGRAFMSYNKSKMLGKFPLETKGVPVIDFAETYDEDVRLSVEIENIEKMVEEIEKVFRKYPVKKKYMESITRLTTIDDGENHLVIDTLSLFIDLNKKTFIEEKEYDHYENSVWLPQSVNNDDVLYNF
jgi:hypothetical protein